MQPVTPGIPAPPQPFPSPPPQGGCANLRTTRLLVRDGPGLPRLRKRPLQKCDHLGAALAARAGMAETWASAVRDS